MSGFWTHDGVFIVFDAEVGTASGRSEHEAWAKIERRKAIRRLVTKGIRI